MLRITAYHFFIFSIFYNRISLIKDIIASSVSISSRVQFSSFLQKGNFSLSKRSPCMTVSDWSIVRWYLALVNFPRCSKAMRQIKGGR